MKLAAILVAAGRGTRAGGALPKQWQPLAGQRVFDWSYRALATHAEVSHVITVVHADDVRHLPQGLPHCIGGETRAASVAAGLNALQGQGFTHVLIHDAARACLSHDLITRVIDALSTHAAAAPALPVSDALWRGENGTVTGTQPREGLYRAQTPQGFDLALITQAHAQAGADAADDVEVARAAGLDVAIVEGHEDNLKVTHPADFERAERILGAHMDIRLGNGFDVHAFTAGDHVVLCGVNVPHEKALLGHSDADVGMHADRKSVV